jgi:hypothetical protein
VHNSSLQRTRLRSPLNSVSLDGTFEKQLMFGTGHHLRNAYASAAPGQTTPSALIARPFAHSCPCSERPAARMRGSKAPAIHVGACTARSFVSSARIAATRSPAGNRIQLLTSARRVSVVQFKSALGLGSGFGLPSRGWPSGPIAPGRASVPGSVGAV